MSLRRDQLPAVTPLRFPAAFVVFVVHAWMYFKGSDRLTFTLPQHHLAAGVEFFFLLSGFILTYNYLDEFRRPTRRSIWNFYVARWARIYPVHVLTALAALPTTLALIRQGHIHDPIAVAVSHLLLVQSFVPITSSGVNAFNGVSWSLSVEFCFYLVLPLLIPALTTGSRVRRGAVLLLVLAPWLAAVASVFGAFTMPAWLNAYRLPPVRMVDFVAGILLGLWWCKRNPGLTVERGPVGRATVAELAAIAGLGLWGWECARIMDGNPWEWTVAWTGVYLPPFAVCLWVFARGGGLVSRVLVSGPLTYLGEISYAFYMIHIPVFLAYIRYGGRIRFLSWEWKWQWAAVGVTTFVLAVACYHLYEIPLRDRLRKRLSIRKPAPQPVAVPEVPARRAA